MSGQAIVYCPPPMPICRPQPAPWTYTPNWSGCQPSPYPQPSSCGCGCPPAAPLFGPIMGVTDGSLAAAGQVGERFLATASMAYADVPASTVQTVSVTVVQPGDWDLWAYADVSTFVNGVSVWLDPAPPQCSNPMIGVLGIIDQGMVVTVENFFVVTSQAAASFSVPTLLAFRCAVFQPSTAGTNTGAGTLNIFVEGRRRR